MQIIDEGDSNLTTKEKGIIKQLEKVINAIKNKELAGLMMSYSLDDGDMAVLMQGDCEEKCFLAQNIQAYLNEHIVKHRRNQV